MTSPKVDRSSWSAGERVTSLVLAAVLGLATALVAAAPLLAAF